ncbi:MAG: hypothetical protein HC906_05600 [Bacteroidales bacterium]|nr:hypothetical protein [Bacteroidales bacterium]
MKAHFIAMDKNIDTKDAIYRIENFNGLLGKLSFDKNGDVVLPIQIKTVKNNKFLKYL